MKPHYFLLILALAGFSASASKNPEQVNVIVEFVLDKKGNVTEPKIVKSTNKRYNEYTLMIVAEWKFDPRKKNGKPISQKVRAPIEFKLTEEKLKEIEAKLKQKSNKSGVLTPRNRDGAPLR